MQLNSEFIEFIYLKSVGDFFLLFFTILFK